MQQSDVSWKVYQLKKKKKKTTLKSSKVFMEEDKFQNKCLDTDSFSILPKSRKDTENIPNSKEQ